MGTAKEPPIALNCPLNVIFSLMAAKIVMNSSGAACCADQDHPPALPTSTSIAICCLCLIEIACLFYTIIGNFYPGQNFTHIAIYLSEEHFLNANEYVNTYF